MNEKALDAVQPLVPTREHAPARWRTDAEAFGAGGAIRKPGNGWHKVSQNAPVWEHKSGLRVHTFGLCRLPGSKRFLNGGNVYPEIKLLDRAIREQGGNRRRGVMVWAMRLMGGGGGFETVATEPAVAGGPGNLEREGAGNGEFSEGGGSNANE